MGIFCLELAEFVHEDNIYCLEVQFSSFYNFKGKSSKRGEVLTGPDPNKVFEEREGAQGTRPGLSLQKEGRCRCSLTSRR